MYQSDNNMKKNITEYKLQRASQEQATDPPAFVWDNIEKELPAVKLKKRVIWWWIGAAMTTILLAVAYLFFTCNQNNSVVNLSSSNDINESIKQKDNALSKTSKTKEIDQINNQVGTNKNIVNNSKKQSISVNKILGKNEQDHNENTTVVSLGNETDDVSINLDLLITNNTWRANKKNGESVDVHIEPNENNDRTDNVVDLRSIYIQQNIALLELSKLRYDRSDILIHENVFTKKESGLQSFIELGVLGGIHNINLSPGPNKGLYSLRNDSESTWYTSGIYGSYGIHLNRHWYVSLGVDWTISKNRFDNTSNNVTRLVITQDATTGMAKDTSFVTGKLYDKGDITFNFIDIPLSFGYIFSKNKWQYGIELTGLLNIRTYTEGKILNQAERNILENQKDIYKNNVGLGIKSSLLISRTINDRCSVQIRPSFKTYFTNINLESYPLDTKYNLFSLSVGVRRNF